MFDDFDTQIQSDEMAWKYELLEEFAEELATDVPVVQSAGDK